MKLDNSFSDAIPKGPLRNITCRLTDQSSKMKKTKKFNNNETQKKKTSVWEKSDLKCRLRCTWIDHAHGWKHIDMLLPGDLTVGTKHQEPGFNDTQGQEIKL